MSESISSANKIKKMPLLRKTTSMTLVLSSIILILSSVIIFISPPSHIAHFSNWSLWVLTRDQWGSIHVVNGLLFIVGCLLHVYYNWRAIVYYMKNRNERLVVFTLSFTFALVITVLVAINAALFHPPSRQIGELGHSINQQHIKTYNVFPYCDVERHSLFKVAVYLGKHPEKCSNSLKSNGIKLDSLKQNLGEIAESNGLSVEELLAIIHGGSLK